MSASGTKRTWQSLSTISAFGGKADIGRMHCNVCFCWRSSVRPSGERTSSSGKPTGLILIVAMALIPVSPCNLPTVAIERPSAKVARVRKSPLPSRPIAWPLRQRVGIDRQYEALRDCGSLALSPPLSLLGHLNQTKPVGRQFKPCLFV